MYVIDVNTTFGKRVDPDPRCSAAALVDEMDRHAVALALSLSWRGAEYDMYTGNDESFQASRTHRQMLPVGTIDPRDGLGWEREIDRCLRNDMRALRLYPEAQQWSVDSQIFRRIVKKLVGSGTCLLLSLSAPGNGPEFCSRVARLTADAGISVVFTDIYYYEVSEVIETMREYAHIYAETNWLATLDAVAIMADAVGVERVLYGSGAPAHPMRKALNQVLETDLPVESKAKILGGNAKALFGIGKRELEGRPQLTDLAPRLSAEHLVDVHAHLGYWRITCRDENYDPTEMLRRMKRYNVTRSVLSSYESMRYDLAAGNREVARAIEGHPELHGYVEVDPYHLELSCQQMDRYYRSKNFAGCEVEATHIPCHTGSECMRKLMREIAKRGRPVLFMPLSAEDAALERELGRQNPDLAIIHAHSFDAEWARVVADTPNIYVEHNQSRPSHHSVRDTIDILGPERVMFGSDHTFLSVGAALGLYLDANLSTDEQRLVLHGNAERVFKLKPPDSTNR